MLGQDTVVFLLYDWPYSLWPITREHQEEKRLRLFKPRFDAKECKWWIINKLLKLLCFFWGEISISGSGHIRLGKTQERGAAGAKWVLGHICLTFWGPLVPYPYFMCVQLGLWIVFPTEIKLQSLGPKNSTFFYLVKKYFSASVCMENLEQHPQLSNISWVSLLQCKAQ